MHGTIGKMKIMDPTGHTEVNWDSDVAAEVATARATFNEMTGQGYRAFKIESGGTKGERMTTFDPKAESMVLIPQLVGG